MMLTEVVNLTMDEHTAQRQCAANYAPILRIWFTPLRQNATDSSRGREDPSRGIRTRRSRGRREHRRTCSDPCDPKRRSTAAKYGARADLLEAGFHRRSTGAVANLEVATGRMRALLLKVGAPTLAGRPGPSSRHQRRQFLDDALVFEERQPLDRGLGDAEPANRRGLLDADRNRGHGLGRDAAGVQRGAVRGAGGRLTGVDLAAHFRVEPGGPEQSIPNRGAMPALSPAPFTT